MQQSWSIRPTPQECEEALFRAAKALAPDSAWRAFLDQACAEDSALRQRLQALLAAYEQPETLLATQAETVRLREDASARQARPTIKIELADAPDQAVGQTLGRYKLLERVGERGCGVVYVAKQTEPVRAAWRCRSSSWA